MNNAMTTQELTQARKDAAVACDKTCLVQRKSGETIGASGETIPGAWQTILTTTAGLSQPSAGQLQNYDYKIGSEAAWQVKLPMWPTIPDVKPQDQLVIDGQTLGVHVDLTPRSFAVLVTVLAAEVK